MTGIALDVDHVGILGAEIDALVEQYRRLGFQIVGPAELTGVDAVGNTVSLGQHSAHIMFADSYIELTAVSKPSPEHHLAEFLDGPAGLRLLLFRAADIDLARERCVSAGLHPGPVQRAQREIGYGTGGTAQFRWCALPPAEFPEALVCYVQHDTFDTVFQRAVTVHDNGAVGLSRLLLRGDALPDHYQALATTGAGTMIEVRSGNELDQLFRIDSARRPPFVGLGIKVRDLAATRRCLEQASVQLHDAEDAVIVSPEHAGGVGLLFDATN